MQTNLLHCGFVLNAKYQFGVLKNDKHWIVLKKKKNSNSER